MELRGFGVELRGTHIIIDILSLRYECTKKLLLSYKHLTNLRMSKDSPMKNFSRL